LRGLAVDAKIIIRLDSSLKSKINTLARAEGKSSSQLVREILETHLKDRDIELYIENLWRRVANKLKAKGVGPNHIDQAIEECRAGDF
jgi:predicted DNA-binding protein